MNRILITTPSERPSWISGDGPYSSLLVTCKILVLVRLMKPGRHDASDASPDVSVRGCLLTVLNLKRPARSYPRLRPAHKATEPERTSSVGTRVSRHLRAGDQTDSESLVPVPVVRVPPVAIRRAAVPGRVVPAASTDHAVRSQRVPSVSITVTVAASPREICSSRPLRKSCYETTMKVRMFVHGGTKSIHADIIVERSGR